MALLGLRTFRRLSSHPVLKLCEAVSQDDWSLVLNTVF